MGRRSRRHDREDEPRPEGEDWVEWGGELVFAVDFTSGGAPIGFTAEEIRDANYLCERSAGWARARRAFEVAFGSRGASARGAAEVGYVSYLGEGMHRKAYLAEVHVTLDPRRSGSYVALLPRPDASDWAAQHVEREARLLSWLATLELPFRAPRAVAVVADRHGPALVESLVTGLPVDLRMGRVHRSQPWHVVGQLAAGIHAIELSCDIGLFDVEGTWRDSARDALSVLDGLEQPEIAEAREWAEDHLPPEEPACLLHGDLTGQSVRLGTDGSLGLIDWGEARLGDPAYDLAIVTRGVRRPLGVGDGLTRLLDAYERAGGRRLPASAVRLHEICQARAGTWRGGERPADLLRRIVNLVRCAKNES